MTPFRTVLDKIQDARKVIPILSKIAPVRSRAEIRVEPAVTPVAAKNMEIRAIRVGNRPLQGTRLLVKIAIRRSLGESIMRQPVTPAALQPKPMHKVRACFPQEWQRWKA